MAGVTNDKILGALTEVCGGQADIKDRLERLAVCVDALWGLHVEMRLEMERIQRASMFPVATLYDLKAKGDGS